MGLNEYRRKRKFKQTPEPKGKAHKGKGKGHLQFVVQMHDASRLHFDFRLEMDGVLKSWAVPKGPSLNPQDRRLAMFVEDHPIEYGSFEGIIPEGHYGGGTVMLWDRGTYVERNSEGREDSDKAMLEGMSKGHVTFIMKGEKLNGEFALVKLKKSEDNAWLLLKKRDEFSNIKREQNFDMNSVKTGRSLEQIAGEAEKKGQVWQSKRNKAVTPKIKRSALTARSQSAKKEHGPLTTKAPSVRKSDNANLKKLVPGPVNSGLRRKSNKQKTEMNGAVQKSRVNMPRKIKPMIATDARTKSPGDDWIYQPHMHGLRAIAEVEGKRVHMYSKSGLPYENKFPDIVAKLSEENLNALLDGEIVGKTYHVFDILYLDGKDLREEPLSERIEVLDGTLKDNTVVKKVKPGKGKGALIAKNPESTYKSGTTSDWLMVAGSRTGKKEAGTFKKEAGTFHDPEQAQLTHPEKVYFPKDGYTKGDVFKYYEQVGEYMLPYLKDRPESLNRHPNGIHQQGFYQKDMTGHLPKWFKTTRIFSESSGKTIAYPMVQDKRSLLYIANLGSIEIHPWFSRIQKLDNPDFLVIDLDPDDNPFPQVVEVAHAFHELLDEIGCANFVKTSGATGIHIGIPTAAKYDFDTVRHFAEQVARVIQKKFPTITSMERTPAKRRKKIYLDCLQNRRGQTLAAPFCIRPRDGAPVSMPMTWKELTAKIKPEQFNIENAPSLIAKLKDPWAAVLDKGVDLNKCLKRLERITNKA